MLLTAGAQHRHQDGLGRRACLCAAAAPDLAVNHRRADGLLRSPVGGVQPGMTQEGEQLTAVPGQVLGQSFIGRVRPRPFQQSVEPALQPATGDGHPALADFAEPIAVTKFQSVLDQFLDLPRKTPPRACGRRVEIDMHAKGMELGGYDPRGAKGIGELSIDGPAPAVINAVAAATGADPREIPLTPERLMAMADVRSRVADRTP